MIIRNFLTRALARRLKPWAERHMSQHLPDFIIGGVENPYLYRWYIRQGGREKRLKFWWNTYLHEIVRSDEDRAVHCHPWGSISIVISGPLSEVRRNWRGREVERHFQDGDIVIRSPWAKHRLVLANKQPPARTIFIVGPRVKEWFFWCPKGPVHWKTFTSGAEGETVGRGCGD